MVMGELTEETELLVIGGGPGGYAAAFRAADLGMDVTMIEADPKPGGTCLFRGCIPSKTLLHLTELAHDVERAARMGVTFSPPTIDLPRVRAWKEEVIAGLAEGLVTLCKKRGVQFMRGRAEFEGPRAVKVHEGEVPNFRFRYAIVATGSRPAWPPGLAPSAGGRVMDSTGALALPDIPSRLLVVGGGYVGLELGSVYASFGSRVTVVEAGSRLAAGADEDLARPLVKRLKELFAAVHPETTVTGAVEHEDRVEVTLSGPSGERAETFDRVLVAVGRRPYTEGLGLETTGVRLTDRGFIEVDEHQRTAESHIFAVGDVVGGAMLAHKAMREGRIAAEAAHGLPSAFDVRAIPAVIYTDPQVAWCGVTEEEAVRRGLNVRVATFPWGASGRAATLGEREGLTKILVDAGTSRILGVGIVGRGAGEMIAEGVLAVEMGALAEDLALSMHPHPTLSETEGEAAEVFLGSPIHILARREEKK